MPLYPSLSKTSISLQTKELKKTIHARTETMIGQLTRVALSARRLPTDCERESWTISIHGIESVGQQRIYPKPVIHSIQEVIRMCEWLCVKIISALRDRAHLRRGGTQKVSGVASVQQVHLQRCSCYSLWEETERPPFCQSRIDTPESYSHLSIRVDTTTLFSVRHNK